MARPFGTKDIKDPNYLLELFDEYRQEVKGQPRKKLIKGNKGFIISDEDLERPLTREGFEVFCFKKGYTIRHYLDNSNNAYGDYCHIASYIKLEIRADQIEGGMVNLYNSQITQRLNNLKEQTESENKVESTKTIIFKHEPIDGDGEL